MRVSLNWMREYAPLDAPLHELVKALVDTGTEVDRVERVPHGVVVCRIVALEDVPESTKGVRFADLDTGGKPVRVLTGAPNVKVGDLVPWAPPGVHLPGWDEPLGVRTMFRKYESPGMLCSAHELGTGEDADGILLLDSGTPGQALPEVLDLDVVLEVDPTTNRPDCLSHVGMARELSAALREPFNPPALEPQSAPSSTGRSAPGILVNIEDPIGCPRFTACVLEDVVVGPSPPWLRRRLEAVGLGVINNVVDVTNYVAAELGQPLHAFDYDRFVEEGGREDAHVIVRRARTGERVACLDGVERELGVADLAVCSGDTLVSVAGIIGGSTTAVGPSTTRVLLESAAWDGASIRSSSRRLGRRTDASALFEKDLSDTLPPGALRRAVDLITSVAGGRRGGDVVDVSGRRQLPHPAIAVTVERVSALLAYDVDVEEAVAALGRLGFEGELHGNVFNVTPPAFRRDVRIAEDVIEEIGRSLGYSLVPATLPGHRSSIRQLAAPPPLDERARDICVGAGFDEAITYSFVHPDRAALVTGIGEGRQPIPISNPLSAEWSVLRISLLPALCAAVAANVNRSVAPASLFEVGRAFWEGERPGPPAGSTPDGADAAARPLPAEPLLLSVASHVPGGADAAAAELRHVQALLVRVGEELSGAELEVRPTDIPGLHPRRAAEIRHDGRRVGVLGELTSAVSDAFDLRGRCVIAELQLDAFASAAPRTPRYRAPSRLPAVVQDLAVTVPADVAAGAALETIREAGGRLLEDVVLYDEYRGASVGDAKGWTFRLTFRADDHTLSGAEATAAQDTILAALRVRCRAEARR